MTKTEVITKFYSGYSIKALIYAIEKEDNDYTTEEIRHYVKTTLAEHTKKLNG